IATRAIAGYARRVRIRRWILAALGVGLVAVGLPVAHEWLGFRSTKLGPIAATPAGVQVAVRTGETVEFAASAEGAVGYTWLVWGRPVSFGPAWTYTAAPEDAGWQQVTLEVAGRRGQRATRTWDVGI